MMILFSEARFHKLFSVLLCLLLAGICLFLAFRYLLGALLPFLLAYGISLCLQPLVRDRSGRAKRYLALVAVFLLVTLLVSVGILLADRIGIELQGLADSLGDFLTRLREDPDFAAGTVDKLNGMIPFFDLRPVLERFAADPDGQLTAWLGRLAERLSGSVLSLLAGAVTFLPNALLSVAVMLIAAYYFTVDPDGIRRAILSLLPNGVASSLQHAAQTLGGIGVGFLRAYGVLALITFCELSVAFLLLGYSYALLLALTVALVDILPVLGTGTVLLPWAVFDLLAGNTKDGVWLLLIYALVTVVRQIIEPRIVGKYIGLPPLAALASMYLGLRLFGIAGLFLVPLGVLFLWKYRKNADPQASL